MTSEEKTVFRVGSRKSELALIQTNFVIDSLKEKYPDKTFTIVTMTTLGDRILDVSLPKIGEKSLFTKDLEDSLRNNTVDFVVHSLKDLPTVLPEGLAIGAVFEREDPRDALVFRDEYKDYTLNKLPAGSVIGTSSLRRTAQLRASYPHLAVCDVRGNVRTRLKKLDANPMHYSALVLATAGLQRSGLEDRISMIMPCREMLYAVGQGALAVECCTSNATVLQMLAPFNHPETYCRILAERSFLRTLGGGCSAPIGVSTRLKPFESQHKLSISGTVWSLDGKIKIEYTDERTYSQITKTVKHKLSPTKEAYVKKMRVTDKSNDGKSKLANAGYEDALEDNFDNNEHNVDNLSSTNGASNNELFCGLTNNTNVPMEVIMDCENLGKDLANALISKGALDVIRSSQEFIRSSVPKVSENL